MHCNQNKGFRQMQYINKVNVKLLNYALSICYQLIVLHCSNVECVHLFCSFQLNTDFRNDYTLYRWTLVVSCQLNSNGLVTRLRHFLLLFRTGQIVIFSCRKKCEMRQLGHKFRDKCQCLHRIHHVISCWSCATACKIRYLPKKRNYYDNLNMFLRACSWYIVPILQLWRRLCSDHTLFNLFQHFVYLFLHRKHIAIVIVLWRSRILRCTFKINAMRK